METVLIRKREKPKINIEYEHEYETTGREKQSLDDFWSFEGSIMSVFR